MYVIGISDSQIWDQELSENPSINISSTTFFHNSALLFRYVAGDVGLDYPFACVMISSILHMDVSENSGIPRWMVKIMVQTLLTWMIWGENPLFLETSTWILRNLQKVWFALCALAWLRLRAHAHVGQFSRHWGARANVLGKLLGCLIGKVRMKWMNDE